MIALDIGPLGKLLEPFGELAFEDAVGYFKELITLGKDRADLILIETMSDLYEIKAAVLAAKEVCALPVFVTVALDQRGRILTGADTETIVTVLEGLGVSALGVNCGFGPHTLAPFVKKITEIASIPVVCNPNAGLPEMVGGRAVYSITPEDYAREMEEILALDVAIVGGCCGTTPDHIAAISDAVKAKGASIVPKCRKAITGYMKTAAFEEFPLFIGNRLMPCENASLAASLAESDTDTLVDEAMEQMAYGVSVAAVSPVTGEGTTLREMLSALQESMGTPFMLVSNDATSLHTAWRYYNGKPMVYAKACDADAVFASMKAYGGMALFEIRENAEADALLATAERCGFTVSDFLIAPIMCSADTFKATLTHLKAKGFMTAAILGEIARDEWASLDSDTVDAVIGDPTDDDTSDFIA